jgi:hypothetical protein
MPTIGLKTFSLSADAKSSFFAGELDILSELSADAAYSALVWTRKWNGTMRGVPVWRESTEEQTLYGLKMKCSLRMIYEDECMVKRVCLEVELVMLWMWEELSRRDRYLKARRRVVTCVRAAPRRAFPKL